MSYVLMCLQILMFYHVLVFLQTGSRRVSSCPKQEDKKKRCTAESLLSHCCPQQLQKLTAQQTQHQRATTTTCIIPKRFSLYFQCWARRVVTQRHPCLAGGIQQLSIVQYRCRYSTVFVYSTVQCSAICYVKKLV